MIGSSSGIHDRGDGGVYLAHAVLDEDVLAAVREANLAFLALVAERHAREPRSRAVGLAPAAAARIAALDGDARRAAAGSPYTLFNLRFEEPPLVHGPAPGRGAAGEAALARTGVFLAWHLAQSSPLAAALALGMALPVAHAWRVLPLSALDGVAAAALPFLAARWADHPVFWTKLLDAAEVLDRDRAAAVRLLGLQLLAADGIRAAPGAGEAPAPES
jgi:hypothetical protein